jgi:hypothetical protein
MKLTSRGCDIAERGEAAIITTINQDVFDYSKQRHVE